jgi:hypothetical protein
MTPAELVTQTHALFLARRNISHPVATQPLRELLPALCQSSNAAVACEAGRLFGALERRRVGDGDAA